MQKPTDPNDIALHRRLAVTFFNETWTLLDKPDRTPDEDARMIHMAHASRMHWDLVGTPQNLAVGEWQTARVHSVLGMKESALYHARRCLDLIQTNSISGFYLGTAHEGMARALRLAQDPEAEKHIAAARSILKELSDPEDAQVLEADLQSIPV